MRRLLPLLILSLQLSLSFPLVAQHPSFGFLIGRSLVRGGDSRALVGPGVTGGDQAGPHYRAFADLPLETSGFSVRAELFYNKLTSGASTYSALGGKAALVDQSTGLTGSFVATLGRQHTVSPYFSLGAGVFTTILGHNPDGISSQVTEEYRGMGSSFMPFSIGVSF
jgi:hypothetical protein